MMQMLEGQIQRKNHERQCLDKGYREEKVWKEEAGKIKITQGAKAENQMREQQQRRA